MKKLHMFSIGEPEVCNFQALELYYSGTFGIQGPMGDVKMRVQGLPHTVPACE